VEAEAESRRERERENERRLCEMKTTLPSAFDPALGIFKKKLTLPSARDPALGKEFFSFF
jgi:hypothetical protein